MQHGVIAAAKERYRMHRIPLETVSSHRIAARRLLVDVRHGLYLMNLIKEAFTEVCCVLGPDVRFCKSFRHFQS